MRIISIILVLTAALSLFSCNAPAGNASSNVPPATGEPADTSAEDTVTEDEPKLILTVTAEEWLAALAPENFTNVTVIYGEVYGDDGFSDNIAYDSEWNKEFDTVDGVLYEDVSRNDGDMDSAEIANIAGLGRESFASFEYSAEKGIYSGAVFYEYNESYLYLEYSFKNGRLAEVKLYEETDENGALLEDDEYLYLIFSDYGTTEVADPTDSAKAALEAALSENALAGSSFSSADEDCHCDEDTSSCECDSKAESCNCNTAYTAQSFADLVRGVDWDKLDTVTFEDGCVVSAVFDHSYEENGVIYGGMRISVYFDNEGRIVRYLNTLVSPDIEIKIEYQA